MNYLMHKNGVTNTQVYKIIKSGYHILFINYKTVHKDKYFKIYTYYLVEFHMITNIYFLKTLTII